MQQEFFGSLSLCDGSNHNKSQGVKDETESRENEGRTNARRLEVASALLGHCFMYNVLEPLRNQLDRRKDTLGCKVTVPHIQFQDVHECRRRGFADLRAVPLQSNGMSRFSDSANKLDSEKRNTKRRGR